MLIRIPLDDRNHVRTPIYPETPDVPDTPDVPETPAFELPEARWALTSRIPSAYASSRYSHPVTPVNVSVPDGDTATVTGWLGNATGNAASETLVKRMTTAVTGAMTSYFTACAREALFTRPFRIGYALRLADGTHAAPRAARLLLPSTAAPLMIVREPRMSGNTLQTLTEIVNNPMKLTVSLDPFTLPDDLAPRVTHLDFYATRQCDVLTGDEQVTAIRSSQYFGEDVNVWSYRRMSEDLVREAAMADTAFRIIGSVPVAKATAGISSLELPSELKNLSDWNNYPALGADDTADPDDPDNPARPYTHVVISTTPLDLGLPETHKHIRGLTVRGVFPRCHGMSPAEKRESDQSLKVSLYGSHHRERWHLLARSAGPHIRLLRAVRYRWLRVEITAPRESEVEALVFEVNRG